MRNSFGAISFLQSFGYFFLWNLLRRKYSFDGYHLLWVGPEPKHRMPVLVQGGDSDQASQRDLRVFALCSLIDKRDASKNQLNIIAVSIFCSLMATWALKLSLGGTCVLLCISICFALYALYTESQTLRQIQRELLTILRDTPRSELQSFFDDQERNLHEDWNKDIETVFLCVFL